MTESIEFNNNVIRCRNLKVSNEELISFLLKYIIISYDIKHYESHHSVLYSLKFVLSDMTSVSVSVSR